ncbi:MAG: lysine decarboxylase LdcC [Legionellales bacterium]|nr:lysine decarboxylase LdcC [Legionellales bacterium]
MHHILFVYDQHIEEYKKHFIHKLEHELSIKNFQITPCPSIKEAYTLSSMNPRVVGVIYDWDEFLMDDLRHFSDHNPLLPIFALTQKHTAVDINLIDFELTLGFLQYDANLSRDDVKRIIRSIKHYMQTILPPFTRALIHYVHELNYSFCTPGHLGGTAFQKTPVGASFYDFWGGNIFLSDLSISMEELGSLLDHSGPQREAEDYIAKVFGSDRSYIVTNGTSTSNKIVGMSCATTGDTVIIDRNCHKSLSHFLMIADVVPLYLKPTRNAYGILGGIPKSEFTSSAIKDKISALPMDAKWPTYAVITHSTYDGILYNLEAIQKSLKVKHLHFDSAWLPYAKFHPIYAGKYAMDLIPEHDQVIFETQSTHKLLAAFSQSSMIHIKGHYNEHILNEVYMMHTSTSPFYPLVASCEVSAAMVSGKQGYDLIQEALTLALDFRAEIKRLKEQSPDWYFDVWQPDEVNEPGCFPLKPEEQWHGFHKTDPDHLYLDPIKVTVLLPGIKNGALEPWGIPAIIVEKFLSTHGMIVEKTGPYSMLFLFSIGITKAKSMALLTALNQFKQMFDHNASIQSMLPQLYQEHPDVYKTQSIQGLADHLHKLIQKYNLPQAMYHAFDVLPEMSITPHQAYQKLIRQETVRVPLKQLKGKICAVMILPYPPGVPLIMPGEKITDASLPILDFLLMLDEIGQALPGFETSIHGVEMDQENQRWVQVISGK